MNTLRGWANKNEVCVGRHAHARTVNIDAPNQCELFRLDDYRVSSVAAGTIWLIRRNPFTESEIRQRANARNLCCGYGILDLQLMAENHQVEFVQDCIAEYLLEVEAEVRDAERRIDDQT